MRTEGFGGSAVQGAEVVAGRVSVNNGQKVKELARAPRRNENTVLPGQKSAAWDRVDHVVCPTDFWFSL